MPGGRLLVLWEKAPTYKRTQEGVIITRRLANEEEDGIQLTAHICLAGFTGQAFAMC